MLKKLLEISILIFYQMYLLMCLHSDKTVALLNFKIFDFLYIAASFMSFFNIHLYIQILLL
jgi:hypothetical protein